jgi:hypothetical protein
LLSALPLWLAFLISLLIVLNTYTMYRHSLQSSAQWLNWRAGDEFLLWNCHGQFQSLSKPRCQERGAWWIISGIDSHHRVRQILIAPDQVTAFQQRQLALLAAIPNNEKHC